MAKQIYKITDQISGVQWYYSSITACLEDVENPLDVSNRYWSQLVKEKGYPFDHSGCKVEKIDVLTATDVRSSNPPTRDA